MEPTSYITALCACCQPVQFAIPQGMHHKIVAKVRCGCGKTVTYTFPAKLSRFFLLEVD